MCRDQTTAGPGLQRLDAAVLAGGLGTRLSSVLNEKPKVLAPVCDRPFLAYLLDQLETAGIRRTVLCTGHLAEQVKSAFGDAFGAMHLVYSQERAPLGTGGALRQALAQFTSDTVLVLNGDSFCAADLAAFWTWHRARETGASLVRVEVPDAGRFGRIETNEHGRVIAFQEKDGAHAPGWINAGMYLLARELIPEIESAVAVSLERDVFPKWIDRGLYAWPCRSPFLDIGTPETYRQAQAFFAPSAVTGGRIRPGVEQR